MAVVIRNNKSAFVSFYKIVHLFFFSQFFFCFPPIKFLSRHPSEPFERTLQLQQITSCLITTALNLHQHPIPALISTTSGTTELDPTVKALPPLAAHPSLKLALPPHPIPQAEMQRPLSQPRKKNLHESKPTLPS
jgi:hypothetical protein